ncbi:MAG: periplasmic heavy metal sensor [Opitutaceae bacterium]|nr:periplasmic heavy metal sensor [Opitutaceae bacterium]
MKKSKAIGSLLIFILGFVLLSAATCFFTVRFMNGCLLPCCVPAQEESFFTRLNLTPDEEKNFHEIVRRTEARRESLEGDFEKAKNRLAQILVKNERYSEEVTKAVHAIHQVHGDLQQLSIEQYYEMLTSLPEEKRENLKNIASQVLSQPQ